MTTEEIGEFLVRTLPTQIAGKSVDWIDDSDSNAPIITFESGERFQVTITSLGIYDAGHEL